MGEQLYSQMFEQPRVICIQARMGPPTRRLPAKELREVMGRPLISYQIERLKQSYAQVVVAIPPGDYEDPLANAVQTNGLRVFRGFADDPPARHLMVARSLRAKFLGFCGGDQTLISAKHFEIAFRRLSQGDCDYVRVVGLPLGLHAWTVTRDALEACVEDDTRNADELEHTGAYWDRRPETFRTIDLDMGLSSLHRLTVDTPEDFEVHRLVLEALYPDNPDFSVEDVIKFLDDHPEISAINRDVSQYYWEGAPREGIV